jgi:hypothetical protein
MATQIISRARRLPEILLTVAVLALIYARMPERIVHGFLWAEDVTTFLTQAYDLGLRSIVTPYAGYLHLVPRVIAYLFSLMFPITWAPWVFAIVCLLITGASAAWIFAITRRVLPIYVAAIMSLALVLVPGNGEIWLTITNLQWVLAPLLLALIWEEFWSDRPRSTVRAVAIVVFSLTGPFGIFFAPFTLIGIARRRRGYGYLIPVAIQAAMTAFYGLPLPPNAHAPLSYMHYPWLPEAAQHLVYDMFLLPGIHHWALAACALAAVVCLCAFSVRGYACVALVALSAALWGIGVVRTGVWTDSVVAWYGAGSRYFYLPAVFIAWSLAIATSRSRYVSMRLGAALLLLMMLHVSHSSFRVTRYPDTTFTRTPDGWRVVPPPAEGWGRVIK